MLEDCLAIPPRRKKSAVLFEDGPLYIGEIDLGKALPGLGGAQFLELNAGIAQQRQGSFFEIVLRAGHPEHARAVKQLPVPALLVFLPQLQRPCRHADVLRLWSVGGANNAGLAAGTGGGVSRTPRVNQRNFRAVTEQIKSRPAAECTGANDGDVRFSIGRSHCSRHRNHRSFQQRSSVHFWWNEFCLQLWPEVTGIRAQPPGAHRVIRSLPLPAAQSAWDLSRRLKPS